MSVETMTAPVTSMASAGAEIAKAAPTINAPSISTPEFQPSFNSDIFSSTHPIGMADTSSFEGPMKGVNPFLNTEVMATPRIDFHSEVKPNLDIFYETKPMISEVPQAETMAKVKDLFAETEVLAQAPLSELKMEVPEIEFPTPLADEPEMPAPVLEAKGEEFLKQTEKIDLSEAMKQIENEQIVEQVTMPEVAEIKNEAKLASEVKGLLLELGTKPEAAAEISQRAFEQSLENKGLGKAFENIKNSQEVKVEKQNPVIERQEIEPESSEEPEMVAPELEAEKGKIETLNEEDEQKKLNPKTLSKEKAEVSQELDTEAQAKNAIQEEAETQPKTQEKGEEEVKAKQEVEKKQENKKEENGPKPEKILFVRDVKADEAREKKAKQVIDEVFEEEPEEVWGNQVTKKLGPNPEPQETSQIVRTLSINQDGSYDEFYDELKKGKYRSAEEANQAVEKLIYEKPAVMKDRNGKEVREEDIARVFKKQVKTLHGLTASHTL